MMKYISVGKKFIAPDTIRTLEMFKAGFMVHYNGEAL